MPGPQPGGGQQDFASAMRKIMGDLAQASLLPGADQRLVTSLQNAVQQHFSQQSALAAHGQPGGQPGQPPGGPPPGMGGGPPGGGMPPGMGGGPPGMPPGMHPGMGGMPPGGPGGAGPAMGATPPGGQGGMGGLMMRDPAEIQRMLSGGAGAGP